MGAKADALAYTVNEAAQTVSVSERTIRRAISSGKLRAVHIGRAVRVPRESLASLLSAVSPSMEDKCDIPGQYALDNSGRAAAVIRQ